MGPRRRRCGGAIGAGRRERVLVPWVLKEMGVLVWWVQGEEGVMVH